MTERKVNEELHLVNIGNSKKLKIKHSVADIFKDPKLLGQITLGVPLEKDWMSNSSFRFLAVKKGDENIGVVYFTYYGPTLVDVHIAVKREHQARHSIEVARKAIAWFQRHPTIKVLGARIPEVSKHASRFASKLGFKKVGVIDHKVGKLELHTKIISK